MALYHVSVWLCPGWADVVTQTWSYWLLGQLHEHKAKDQARAVGFYKMVRGREGAGRSITASPQLPLRCHCTGRRQELEAGSVPWT